METNMDIKQLKHYLKTASDMEAAVYSCDCAIQELSAHLAKPIKELAVPEPSYPAKPLPQAPAMPMKPVEPRKPTPEKKAFQKPRSTASILGKALASALFPSDSIFWELFAGFWLKVLGVSVAALCILFPLNSSGILRLPPDLKLTDLCVMIGIGAVLLFRLIRFLYLSVKGIQEKDVELKIYRQNIANQKQYNENNQAAYERDMLSYHKQMAQYESDCLQAQRRAVINAQEADVRWQDTIRRMQDNHAMLLSKAKYSKEMQLRQRSEIEAQRSQLQKRLAELRQQLKELYQAGPLYPTYQNMVAVSQLYDYIASGISNTLDGPYGAYSQYMNDVRAARICESIDSLRNDMLKGFKMLGSIQHQLLTELESCHSAIRDVERAINNMDHSMSGYMREIDEAIRDSGNYTRDMSDRLADFQLNYERQGYMMQQMADNAQDLSRSLSAIRESSHTAALNTSMIAFNQHLDMLSRGVSGYYSAYGR